MSGPEITIDDDGGLLFDGTYVGFVEVNDPGLAALRAALSVPPEGPRRWWSPDPQALADWYDEGGEVEFLSATNTWQRTRQQTAGEFAAGMAESGFIYRLGASCTEVAAAGAPPEGPQVPEGMTAQRLREIGRALVLEDRGAFWAGEAAGDLARWAAALDASQAPAEPAPERVVAVTDYGVGQVMWPEREAAPRRDAEPIALCAEIDALRAALRRACDDAFADGEGAARQYEAQFVGAPAAAGERSTGPAPTAAEVLAHAANGGRVNRTDGRPVALFGPLLGELAEYDPDVRLAGWRLVPLPDSTDPKETR